MKETGMSQRERAKLIKQKIRLNAVDALIDHGMTQKDAEKLYQELEDVFERVIGSN